MLQPQVLNHTLCEQRFPQEFLIANDDLDYNRLHVWLAGTWSDFSVSVVNKEMTDPSRRSKTPWSLASLTRVTPNSLRWISHFVVWGSFLIPAIMALVHGFLLNGDQVRNTIPSINVFSLHPPLVGPETTTQGTDGVILFDPGPMMYWILAIPVRIAPVAGQVIGAAIAGAVVLSIAIEAAWSQRQWFACLMIALASVDQLWKIPVTRTDLLWNAYFPIPFLMASMVLAWVVACGSWCWMPVLVITASVAMQTHLINFVPCAALVVLAPITALVLTGRPTRWRWAWISLIVGLICWIAPLVQNFFGSHPNLSGLAHSGSGVPHIGFKHGFQAGAAIFSWPPFFLRTTSGFFYPTMSGVFGHPLSLAFFEIGLLALIAVLAWRRSYLPLAALSCVALVVVIGESISFSVIPHYNLISVGYVQTVLWSASFLVWSVVVWAGTWVVALLWHRWLGSKDTLEKVKTIGAWVMTLGTVGLFIFAQVTMPELPSYLHMGS